MVRNGPTRVRLKLCFMQLFPYVWGSYHKKYLFVYGYAPLSPDHSLKILFPTKKKSLEKWLMFSQGEKCHIEHLVPADTQLPSRQKRSGTNLERITLTKQGAKLSISNFNKTVNMFKSIIFNYKKPNQSLLKEC